MFDNISFPSEPPQEPRRERFGAGKFAFVAFVFLFALFSVGILTYFQVLDLRTGPEDISVTTVEGPSFEIFDGAVIDETGEQGINNSITVIDGVSYVSYYDDTVNKLKYAVSTSSGGNCGGGNWNCGYVDGTANTGLTSVIAKGADQKPVIVYSANGGIRFAKLVGAGNGNGQCGRDPSSNEPITSWSCEVVYSFNQSALYVTDILVSSAGNIFASVYNNAAPRQLYLLQYTGSGTETSCTNSAWLNNNWMCETVSDNGALGSLSFDENNVLNMSFYRGSEDAIYIAKRTGSGTEASCMSAGAGNWNCAVLHNFGQPRRDYPLASELTQAFNGHLIMGIIDGNNIYFAEHGGQSGTCTNTEWGCELVDSINPKRQNVNIFLHPTRHTPVLSYWNQGKAKMMIAEQVAEGGNCTSKRWFCAPVASVNNFGGWNDLSVDDAGNYRMTYWNADTNDLSYIGARLVFVTAEQKRRRQPEPPPPVLALTGYVDENMHVVLLWKDPVDDNLDHIEILRNYNPIEQVITGEPYATVRVGVETYTDTTVETGNTYRYIVRSMNDRKEYANSNEIAIVVSLEIPEEEVVEEEVIEEAPEETPEDISEAIDEEPVSEVVVEETAKPCGARLVTRNQQATIQLPAEQEKQEELGFQVKGQCLLVFDILQKEFTPALANLSEMQIPVNVFVKKGLASKDESEELLRDRSGGASNSDNLPIPLPLFFQSYIGIDGVSLYRWNSTIEKWEKVPEAMIDSTASGVTVFSRIEKLGVYTVGREK